MESEKEWLKRNVFHEDIDEGRIQSILYFTLIWNIFEKECCEGHAKIDKHSKELSKRYAKECISQVASVWEHFSHRYVENGKMTKVFKDFTFYDNDNKPWVEAVLRLNEKADEAEKMEALLRIAFRLRNNLYHGSKPLETIYSQNENFRQINILLMAIIDAKKGWLQ